MRSLRQCIRDIDIAVIQYLNPPKENHWVIFFQALSNTTSEVAYGLPILLLLIGLFRKSRTLLVKAALVMVTVIIADYTALFLKGYINRARPFVTITGLMHYSDTGNASFPSGHTTQAIAMAMAVTLLFRKPIYSVAVLVWALMVGYSRIYLGVHYPSDVAGGILLSTVAALLIFLTGKWMGALSHNSTAAKQKGI